jgi:hypothetical protein
LRKLSIQILKAAAQSELRAENFVLVENQEQHADGNAQSHERSGIGIWRCSRPSALTPVRKAAACEC